MRGGMMPLPRIQKTMTAGTVLTDTISEDATMARPMPKRCSVTSSR